MLVPADADTVGMVHVPLTAVNVPPVATSPDQFRDVCPTVAGGPLGLVPGGMFVRGCLSPLIFHAGPTMTRV
jgi:hypothetical protein